MKKLITGLAIASALLVSTASYADPHKSGDWLVRAGFSGMSATSGDNTVVIKESTKDYTFSTDEAYAMGFNIAYFLDRNWAVEVSTASPFKHRINVEDAGVGKGKVAHTSSLPLMFSGLYYLDRDWDFKPYVGAGLHYTFFFSSKISEGGEGLGFKDLKFGNAYGFALQAGADYQFTRNWSSNVAVRYTGLSSDTSFTYGSSSNKGSGTLNIDPWVLSVNVGYKF